MYYLYDRLCLALRVRKVAPRGFKALGVDSARALRRQPAPGEVKNTIAALRGRQYPDKDGEQRSCGRQTYEHDENYLLEVAVGKSNQDLLAD